MTRSDILDELQKLPLSERLAVIENVVRLIRNDLGRTETGGDLPSRRRRMAEAAEALLPDYRSDPELTAFSALDGQEFHEEG
jgi:hypothetical protein